MVTLHSYVLRELLKTFLLAQTAVTVLFTAGGGLFNMVRYEGVSAGDVVESLHLLIPIVVTLTMPMAALFAATMVYGRLAADNELLACRAAGINIHRLFVSVLLLSVFVSSFTLLFGGFIIPGYMQQIDRLARSNIRDFAAQQLRHKGFIHRGKSDEDRYTITAERVQGVSEEALREKNFEVDAGLQYLLVHNPTFLHVDRDGKLVRFTVADYVLCVFDTRTLPIRVTFHVRDGQDFEVGKRAVVIDQQQIGPIEVPIPSAGRLSMADLGSLFRWQRQPWGAPRIREDYRDYINDLTRQRYLARCAETLLESPPLVLEDEDYDRTYMVACDTLRWSGDNKRLILENADIRVDDVAEARPLTYDVERADLTPAALPSGRFLVELRLVSNTGDTLRTLDLSQSPDQMVPEHRVPTPAEIRDPDVALALPESFEQRRIGLQKGTARMERKLAGTIHFRLGSTASALVILIMGAALGVIFRGARALAAFALAMVPFFCVTVVMALGQQLTHHEQTHYLGPFITWGGLGVVALTDLCIIWFGVRR